MIVCIFGQSCVGKTAVGRRAATLLDLPFRPCGDAVRQKAEALGMPVDKIPREAHRAVDAATVAWALERRVGCMLEGRFLDAVFAVADVSIMLIELQADRSSRFLRARLRTGRSDFSLDDLDRLDADDLRLRSCLFGQFGSAIPRRALDSSSLSIEECARRVREMVEASDSGRAEICA